MKSNEKERKTMRIKKLTAVAMTGMMVLGMGTSVCAAEPISPSKGAGTKEVRQHILRMKRQILCTM